MLHKHTHTHTLCVCLYASTLAILFALMPGGSCSKLNVKTHHSGVIITFLNLQIEGKGVCWNAGCSQKATSENGRLFEKKRRKKNKQHNVSSSHHVTCWNPTPTPPTPYLEQRSAVAGSASMPFTLFTSGATKQKSRADKRHTGMQRYIGRLTGAH